jgi:hypothetical protein
MRAYPVLHSTRVVVRRARWGYLGAGPATVAEGRVARAVALSAAAAVLDLTRPLLL